ncbi:MAG: PDGLE domain-containing protein [Chloroflexota bacterium]
MKKSWWVIGLALALVVAILSPLASPHPDGLERVAEDKGFIDRAQESHLKIIPDYVFPGVGNEAAATILAGVVGTLVMFGLMFGVGRLLRRRSTA